MSKKWLPILLVLALVFTLTPFAMAASSFTDVDGHWAEDAIVKAVDAGYVKGYPDGTFKPNGNITRAEFVTMMNEALDMSEVSSTLFTDVTKDSWFYSDVQKGVFACYVKGYEDNTFRPNNLITRAEAATIVSRIVPTTDNLDNAALAGFTDRSSIASWAQTAAGAIADKGYINGYPDGTFGPTGYLTRAEAVSIINRILENENVIDSKASLQEDGDSLKNGIYVGGVEVAKSVGEGSVTIDDGMLLSTAQVLGGGADTVEVRDTFAAVMNVNKNGDDPVNIKMVGNTTIQRLNLFGNAILSESNLTGSGVVDAYITGNEKTETFEVSGEIEHLTIDRVCTVTVKDGGSIELVTINVDGVKLYVEDGGYVGTVEANGDTKLKDAEPVGHLIVNNGSDNTYQTEPDKITINDGTAEPEEEESGLSGGGSSGGGGGGGGGSTSTSLAAPKDFKLTHEGQGQYTFGWGNVEHAAEYTVTIKNGSTTVAESFTVAVPATGTPSFDLDEKLGALPEDATNYTVTVTAKAAAGSKYKDKSANATVKLLAAPDVTLTGNSGIDTAALSWGAVPNADDYLLLYQVAGSGDTMTEVTIPEGALTIALKDYLTQEDTSYVLRLVATSDAEMTLSNSWSATVTRRANSDQISNLRLVEDAGVYSIAWDGVAGSGGYIIHVNDGTIIPDVEVAEGTTTYAVPNTWLENGNLTVAVSAKNQDSTADMVIGGGAIAPAQHGFNAPAAPNSPQAIADTVNPYQITWNGVSFADGGYEALITDGTNSYPVTLSGKLADGITDKVTSVNNGGITKYTANLAEDFANLPLGTYTLQIRSAGLTALSDGKNYTIPSTYATVKAADGSGSDQTYELSQLEQPKGFQIAEVTGGEQLTWGAVTNATGYELSLTEPDADTKEGDNTYAGLDAALIFNATNTPAPKADPADPDVCILDTVGAHDVWVRATSTDPKVTNSEWAKVTIDRLAAPGFSVDETANMGLNQAFESTVILTLTPVTNQTGLSLVDANGAVTLDDQNQVDVSASFQLTGDARATGITIPYTYRALGDEGTAKAVDAGGTLYLGSLPATQNVQRLAQPTGFTLAPEYSSVVAPFDTDAAKLGASERTYVVTWPQVKSTATTNANYGYKLTCELFPLDDAYSSIAASDADTGSWTVPQTWRNTNSAYTTLVIAAQQGLADFALQSYPTQITFDTATINTLLKPAAPTYTFASNTYTINWAATTGVSFYDLLITYTDADGNVTDVTPATGFQGIEANDAAARVKDITAVITEDVGTYNVYVRSTDRIGTGEANIGSDWSEPLAITNNQLAQVTDLQANQTIDTTAGSPTFGQETVTLTWTNSTSTPAAPVTYQLYVKDTTATDYTDADGNTYRLIDANATSGIDITTVVQDPTVLEYSFIVVATTTDAAWLDSEATQVKVTRQAQPGLSMADNGSGVAVLTISAAALEPELYVDETQKAVAYDANIKTATYEATEMTDGVTLNLAVIIPSAEVNNLASIVKTQTAQRLATPDTTTFALNYTNGTDYTDGYTLAWDAITNATGYKVIHGMQNDDVTNVDTNAFAIPGNWIDNPASYQLTVTAVGDAGQFIMNSTASSLYSFQTLAAPVNPVLAADGTLTWTGSPAAKYSIVSIQKDGVDIAVDPAYTGITGALDNSTDLLPVIQTNGSGKYVVTLRSDDNFATKVLGSAPVATAADAASGTEFKIAKAPDMATEVVGTPAGATVVLQWPVAGYVSGYTVTIDGDTATNAVTISGGTATLTLADTDFDAYDTEYPLVITAIPEAGAFAGDPTSSTIKRVSPVDGSSFQIVVGSVYLVWNAVATDDVVDYYSITRTDGDQQVATDIEGNAYEVKVASDVMKGDGTPVGTATQFCVDITADFNAAGSHSYTVTRLSDGSETQFKMVSGGVSANDVTRLESVNPASFTITYDGALDTYTLGWDSITGANQYKLDDAGTAATADTNAYTFTPAAAGSEKAISVTASSTENFKLDSLVPAVANIYTLDDITGINNLTGDVYTWNSVTNATNYELRVLDSDGAEVTAIPRVTTTNNSATWNLADLIAAIQTPGQVDAAKTYDIQVRAINTEATKLTVPGAWTTVLADVQPADVWEVTVTVLDGAGAPIQNATVQAGGETASTDENGTAVLLLASGEYAIGDITASAADYATGSNTAAVTVGNGEANAVTIILDQATYDYTFTVTNADGSDFDALNAALIIDGDTANPQGLTAVDAKTYTATVTLRPGEHSFAVTGATYTGNGYPYVDIAGTTFTVDETADQGQSINLEKQTFKAVFRVQNSDSALLNGANLAIDGPTVLSNVAVYDGRAEVQLLPGDYNITASLSNYKNNSKSFTMAAADMDIATDASTFTMVKVDNAALVLTALSGTTPAAGLEVSLYASEADALAATNALGTETTDASGEVTFTGLNSGDYWYTAAAGATGYDDVAATQIAVDAAGTAADIAVTVPFTVTAVSGADGIDGVAITLGTETLTTANGGEVTFHVAAGDYELSAAAFSGYNAIAASTVTPAALTATETELTLTKPVTFTVKDLSNGSAALEGATITIYDATGSAVSPAISGVTDSTGTVTLNLVNGSYKYQATKPGYNDTALTGSDFVVATTPETVSVPLAEMSANGTATFQTKVQLVDNNNSITDFSAVTLSLSGLNTADAASGTYTGALTAGSHSYTLTYDGTVIASGSITVTASNDVADNTTEIALHNVTFDATDLADVEITVTGNTIAGTGLVATTAADGNVTVILADATGDYSYSAAKTDYATVSGTFSGTGTSVLFSLTKADASAVVTVTSVAYPGTGAAPALVGAQVSLYDVDPAANPGASALETVTSDGDGKATFTVDLTAGETYYLVATMAHHNDATGSFTATAGDNTAALQLVEFQKRAATFVGAQDGDVISIYSDAAHNNLITTLDGTANFTTGSNVTLYATETYYYTYTSGGATSASTFVMTEGSDTPFEVQVSLDSFLVPVTVVSGSDALLNATFADTLLGDSIVPVETAANVYSLSCSHAWFESNPTFDFVVKVPGYNDETINLTKAQAAAGITVEMTRPVTFTIKDLSNSSALLEGVTVSVYDAATSTLVDSASTDAQGTVTLDLQNGSYKYQSTKPGYNDTDLSDSKYAFTVATTPETAIQLEAGMVKNATATFPVEVTLTGLADYTDVALNLTGLTAGADGLYSGNLAAGNHNYTVTYQGTEITSGTLTVAASSSVTTETIALHNVTFDAYDEADVTITITGNGIAASGLVATTGADGNVTVVLADADSAYNYSAAKAEFGTVTDSFGGKETAVSFQLTAANLNVPFKVTAQSGPAVENATVTYYTTDAGAATTLTTNASGLTTPIGLNAGDTLTYSISAYGYEDIVDATVTASESTTEFAVQLTKRAQYQAKFNNVPAGSTIRIYKDNAGAPGEELYELTGDGYQTPASSDKALYADYTYHYEVSAPGFNTITGTFNNADTNQKVIDLAAPTITATVTVKSGATEVSSATVSLGGAAPTDVNGNVYTFQITEGNHTLAVDAIESFNAYIASVDVNTVNNAFEVNLVGDIAFRANVADVTFALSNGTNVVTTVANTAVTEALADGSYSYTANATGYKTVNGTFTVKNGALSDGVTVVDANLSKDTDATYPVTFKLNPANSGLSEDVIITVNGQPYTITAGTTEVTVSDVFTATIGGASYSYTVSFSGSAYDAVAPGTFTVNAGASNEVVLPEITVATPPVVPVVTKAVLFNVKSGSAQVTGATITLTEQTSSDVITLPAVTGQDGFYYALVPVGTYDYEVTSSSYPTETGTLTVEEAASEPISQTVELAIPYTVKVTSGGSPVSGATVEINGNSQTTDANGEAQFALATGSNSYTVTATGYATVSDSVNVTASTTLEVALVSENSIEFMLDADPATDLTAATVVITAGTGTEVYNGLGDSSLDLGQLADGEYTYSVTLDNYYTVSDTFVVENGAASGNSASLQQAADAKYNVTFDFTGGNTITLNIDGTQYDNISAGDAIELGLGLHAYKVVGDVNYLPSTDWEFFTVTDETTPGTVTVTLVEVPTTVDITIYVKDATNSSVDSLVLVNGATVELDGQTETSVDGKVSFTGVTPGELDYTITASGYDTISGQLNVDAATSEYTLELTETVVAPPAPTAKNVVFTITTGTNANPGGILTIIGGPDNDVQNFVIAAGAVNSQQIELTYGNYSFKFIPDGDTVTAPGWENFTVDDVSTNPELVLSDVAAPVIPTQLQSPTSLRLAANSIQWDEVVNATAYQLELTDGNTILNPTIQSGTTTYALSNAVGLKDGQISVKIKAIGDGVDYTDSTWSNTIIIVKNGSSYTLPTGLAVFPFGGTAAL